jgi:hypothetical protein
MFFFHQTTNVHYVKIIHSLGKCSLSLFFSFYLDSLHSFVVAEKDKHLHSMTLAHSISKKAEL